MARFVVYTEAETILDVNATFPLPPLKRVDCIEAISSRTNLQIYFKLCTNTHNITHFPPPSYYVSPPSPPTSTLTAYTFWVGAPRIDSIIYTTLSPFSAKDWPLLEQFLSTKVATARANYWWLNIEKWNTDYFLRQGRMGGAIYLYGNNLQDALSELEKPHEAGT